MKVQRWFLNNSLRNYQYLLHNSQYAIAIDPLKSDIYLNFINERNLSLKAILITHSHGDHIAGVKKLKQAFPNAMIYAFRDNEIFTPDVYVKDNDIFNLGFCTFKVLYTPGHIGDHVCYLFDAEKALFCGDTLFNAGVGGVKDSTANVDQLYDSIVKINQLDPNICLYSAHDYWESNLNFALSILPNDKQFLYYKNNVAKLSAIDKPILNIAEESKINIFMRSINDKSILDKFPSYELGRELFIKFRGLKDIF